MINKGNKRMKICLVGPGIMKIPPTGWGAVEVLIWDYYRFLTAIGHSVTVINTKDREKIVEAINSRDFDFVHIHYDCFVDIIPKLKIKNVGITSHYPFIETRPDKDYQVIFEKMIEYCNSGLCFILALNMKDLLSFIKGGCDKNRILLTKNGVSEEIKIREKPKFNKSICLAKIEPRKRQYLTSGIENIDYYGSVAPGQNLPPNYMGEMRREEVYSSLTNYVNLVLLSESENMNPLVVMESLMAGLGVVVSEGCGCRDNGSFITVIEENRIRDTNYIREKIEENKKNCKNRRGEIRTFAVDNFGWQKIMHKYLEIINYIISDNFRKKTYCFVCIGQLRTWEKAVPQWREQFSKLTPDIYLFLDEPDNHPSIDKFKEVFGKDCKIKNLHFWTSSDTEEWNSTCKLKERDIRDVGYSKQFFQLQKAFKMVDFSNYDVVIKFRLDAVPRRDRPFFIEADWSKHEHVIPHISDFWRNCTFQDYYREGRLESYHRFGEGKTLGGAYVINKEEEYKIIDKNKVVWMINDHVYWSTGKNMHKLHQSIFDNYGGYFAGELEYNWTPEATLIYHCKAVGLQPLMTMAVDIIR